MLSAPTHPAPATPSRRPLRLAVLALTSVLALAACGGDADSSDGGGEPLAVGIDSGNFMSNLPMYVAIDKGFFTEAGLGEVTVTNTGDNFAAGLISGSVDISFAATIDWFAAGKESGEDIRWLGPLRDTEYLILGGGPAVKDAQGLVGKKVTGGPVGGDNDANLREMLGALGLSESDVEIVPTDPGSDAWLAAVLAGQLDGSVMFPRHVAPLEENGGTVIYQDLRESPQDGYATTQEFLDENPGAVQAFFEGMLKARAFYKDPANKDEVFKIMSDNDFDTAVIEPAWDLELAQHSLDGGFAAADVDAMVERAKSREQVAADLVWSEWVALDSLWAAQEAMGLELRPTKDEIPSS